MALPNRVDPELRRFAAERFKPVHLHGLSKARAQGPTQTRDLLGRPGPTHAQWALYALGAVAAGAVVGWFWRKHREAVARKKAAEAAQP